VIAALVFLWAESQFDESGSVAAICQSAVLPGHADATYAPALRDAAVAGECGPAVAVGEQFPWGPVLQSGRGTRRLEEYLFTSN